MSSKLFRRSAATVAALTLSLSLAACGGAEEAADTAASAAPSAASSAPTDTMTDTMTDTPTDDMTDEASPAADAGAQTFGPACSAVPATGAGSFNGMATAPVASAASANPLLSTLVTAVKEAGLVDTLNSAEALTVFAPTNDAFGKIPKKDLDAVLADKATLTKILTHHVVAGELAPDQLAGTHETLAGDKITITGSGEKFDVAKEKAQVLCGNVPTANATVYIVDTVLMP